MAYIVKNSRALDMTLATCTPRNTHLEGLYKNQAQSGLFIKRENKLLKTHIEDNRGLIGASPSGLA